MSHRIDESDVRALVKLAIELADRRQDPDAAGDILLQRLRMLTDAASATMARVKHDGRLHDARTSGQRLSSDGSLLASVVSASQRCASPVIHSITRVQGRSLFSALPIGDGVTSVIALQQARGARHRWGRRETVLLDLLHPEIASLYPSAWEDDVAGGLSPRQRQTLRLLLRGLSEKQIAASLKLSVHTVHVYVKAIYRAYHISSRAELLAKWVKTN